MTIQNQGIPKVTERPRRGDYIRLSGTENHTSVDSVRAYSVWDGSWRIWTMEGEEYLIQRLEAYDTDERKAWEVVSGS